jgi:spermidine synthase
MLSQYLRVTRLVIAVGCALPLLVWASNIVVAGQQRFAEVGIPAPTAIPRFFVAGLAPGPEGYAVWGKLLIIAATSTVAAIVFFLPRRLIEAVENISRQQLNHLASLPEARVGVAILVSAALSLVLELSLIRWQGAVFEMFAFYKNFGVLACFAGLGLGYATARHQPIPLVLTIPLLAWQFLLFVVTRYGPPGWSVGLLRATPVVEQLNMGSMGSAVASLPQYFAIMLLLAVTFMITALALLPVGQLCGSVLERRPKLRAYGLNLFGSLAGVVIFFALGFLWTPPLVWFTLSFVALLAFQTFDRRVLVVGVVGSAMATVILAWPFNVLWKETYSPYQLLELGPASPGTLTLRSAGHYYQKLLNLSPGYVQGSEDAALKHAALYYELPYRVIDPGSDVAIVGAGTGNDVAAGLRMGVARIDAVEIDPAIIAIGKAYHPERPYEDLRVHIVVNDARTYLKTTRRSYDAILYGLLDSHTLLSHASNVRLDSFVYTVEAFREARSRLKAGGVLSLSFTVLSRPMGRKIYLMLREAFDGTAPICIAAEYDGAVIFLVRERAPLSLPPDLLHQAGFIEATATYADPAVRADVSTDEWPFFYMPVRTYPVSYVAVIALILALSWLLLRSVASFQPRFSHSAFFFLGAGFLLVETKNITQLGLTFGNTWQVIGIAIAGILVMGFVANALVERLRPTGVVVPYVLLLAALALGIALAITGGLPPTISGRLATLFALSCPLFFSGIAFSTALQYSEDVSGALAANLFGAMCGGLLEYNSMYFGFTFLYWIAILAYSLAFVSLLRLRSASPSGRA